LKAPHRVGQRVEELDLRVAAPYPPDAPEEDKPVWAKIP
jgi:hypothetical protein